MELPQVDSVGFEPAEAVFEIRERTLDHHQLQAPGRSRLLSFWYGLKSLQSYKMLTEGVVVLTAEDFIKYAKGCKICLFT
jgi:hypothetical protein